MRLRLTIAAAGIALAIVLAVAIVSTRTAEPALALTPTPSWTSTPTRTPTATPSPLVANYTFTNTTGAAADALDIVAGTSLSLTVTSNAPGCDPPTLFPPETIGHQPFDPGPGGPFDVPIKLYRVRWDSTCVGNTESVGVQFTYGSDVLFQVLFLAVSRTGTFFDSSIATNTPTLTPEPSLTPTPTPTSIPNATVYTLTNADVSFASYLGVTFFLGSGPHPVQVITNAPGCATPPLEWSLLSVTPPHPNHYVPPTWRLEVTWPTACVDLGETVVIAVGGEIYNFLGHWFATQPSVVPEVLIQLDCDTAANGIQSTCSLSPGASSADADIVVTNTGPSFQLGAFGLTIENLDLTRLIAPATPCSGAGFACNPEFDQASVTGIGWACSPPSPSPDGEPGMPGQQSFIACFNGATDGPIIPGGGSLRVGTITYSIAPGAPAGTTQLTLRDGSVYDESFGEKMSCNPTITVAGPCNGASITISEGPTVTPTNTPFPVPATPIPTSTAAAPTAPPAAAVASQNLSPTPAGRYFAIDCDLATAGIQDDCTYTTDAGLIDVGVVLVNNGGPDVDGLATFNFNMRNPDTSRLNPPAIPDVHPFVNSNPDANEAALSPTIQCSPPPPDNDTGADGPGTSVSLISCFDGAGNGFPLPAGASVLLGRVHYNVPLSAQPGTIPLALDFVAAYDLTFSEIGSCEDVITEPATCVNASITLIGPGPGVEKIPDGNENNADLTIPAANLWICEAPASCAGPGEGELRVIEQASDVHSDTDGDNIPDGTDPCVCTGLGPDNQIGTADDTNPVAPPFTDLGLGAYEFSVEYDNFVIQSVNPCDIVFGTGSPPGAGANRGPVDELNSSAINPDCFGDAGPAAPGSCAMSLILENIIHFGCVTSGTNLGPTGDMDLATLLLIPHPDLKNDLFPGNNNGVLTVLKDNGCELVDTLGHPVHGSVNGGLTPYCRDLAVTVRILEGDLDLDCDVDLTDAQAIASRYGAFFGGLLYSKWYDLEPQFHDLDIDIKDVQKVFGRQNSTCDTPIPAQPPLGPPTAFGD